MLSTKILKLGISFLILFSFFACDNNKSETIESNVILPAFELLESSDTGLNFQNTVESQADFNVLTYRNYYNGGGVAIGDINNDGLNDIYLTANMTQNKLFLNKGEMKFEDITEPAGIGGTKPWSTGVTMVDINQDGLLDIYVCNSGDLKGADKENELFINLGNNKFQEAAATYGLNDQGLSTHANFFDYDLDGDLDCYILNNSYKDPERISLYERHRSEYDALGGDRLFRNDDGKFTNVTQEAGLYSSNIGFGLGISVGDVNNDLYPDIYISNDFWERDYLYINNKNGTFSEKLTSNVPYTSVSSMGSDIADINNDGNLDIFSTDMLPPDNYRIKAATKFDDYYQSDLKYENSYYYQFLQNCLQINKGDGTFQESANFSGVAATDWSWGALIFDMNMDGQKDLFVSNGLYHDITDSDFIEFIGDRDKIKKVVEEKGRYDFRDFEEFLPHNKRKNYAFINQNNLRFSNQNARLGMDQESYSNGAAYGDLDNDGDFDLVVNNVNMEAFLYKNAAVESKQNFLKIKLKGSDKNRNGIGTTIILYSENGIQKNQVMMARGFQSSVDPDIIFGLGSNHNIDSLTVIWPDRKFEIIKTPKANQVLNIDYRNASSIYTFPNYSSPTFFDITKEVFKEDIFHKENHYIDFDSDRLMLHMQSADGPAIVKGDINKDGKEDFIMLGAMGEANQLFLNNGKSFTKSNQSIFKEDKEYEGVSGALFDLDGDGDQDLVVGLGGNEYKAGFEGFATRMYLNDGNGNFILEKGSKLIAYGQISCVKPHDYDKDGDLDLFLGGKAIPGAYGLTPRSFMLQNDGKGNFKDVTNEQTGPVGMVTDAIWTDIDNNGWDDLIIVGEWMPITVLMNNAGAFVGTNTLENSNGWWTKIKSADLDQDGDLDYVIGNWGENMKLKASPKRPVSLYVRDFDANQRPDAILEWFGPEDDKPYPFASKMDITTQLPALKKTILKYQVYGKKQVSDIFSSQDLDKAEKKVAYNFKTSIIWNNNGKMELEPFLDEAQMSPVFAIAINDLDGDGIVDIFLGGNFYRLKPEIGRHDGFDGGYYKGLGNGKYQYITSLTSGIKTRGEVREAFVLNNALIIARNNNSLISYKKN